MMESFEICRLCVNSCDDYLGLFDDDNHPNEVHEIMCHYFNPMMLSVEQGEYLKVICSECWGHIVDFHNFQVSIIQAQSKLIQNVKEVLVIEKSENPAEDRSIDPLREDIDSVYVSYLELIGEQPSPSDKEKNKIDTTLSPGETVEVDIVDENIRENIYLANEYTLVEISNDETTQIEEIDVQYCSDPEVSIADCVIQTSSSESENAIKQKHNNSRPKNDDNLESNGATDEVLAAILSIITKPVESGSSGTNDNSNNSLGAEFEIEQTDRSKSSQSTYDNDNSQDNNTGMDQKKNSKPKSNAEKINESDEIIAKWLPSLSCIVCRKTWPTFSLLKKHFRQIHRDILFSVACCERNFTYRCQLEEHVRLHLDPNAFSCKKCDRRFSSRANLCAHKQSQCIPTEKVTEKKSLTDIDKLVAQWRPILECEICFALCPSFTLLKDHFRKKHPNEEFFIVCCERKLTYRCHIENHVRLHIDANSFKCDVCGKSFTNKSNLKVHKASSHAYANGYISGEDVPNSNDKSARKTFRELDATIAKWRPVLECVKCKENCSTFTQLSDHFRLKHKKSELFIKCCGTKFKSRNHVEEHARTHLYPDSFKCKHCDKRFQRQFKLRSHMRLEHPVFETVFVDE